jgi:hypothetical protein
MRPNPLLIHLGPEHRELFTAGHLIAPAEVDMVDLRGQWDQGFRDFAVSLDAEIYAYLQVFTSPAAEWARPLPAQFAAMDALPRIPLVRAWAMGREAIDWPRVGLPVALAETPPLPVTGYFLDNFFPDLEPWMFGEASWTAVPSLGPVKRRAYAARMRDFERTLFAGGRILNGRPGFMPAWSRSWVMVERAAARVVEAVALVESSTRTILSIPAEETWNIAWVLNQWTSRPGIGLSFTSDSEEGLSSAASILAYERAIEHRKAGLKGAEI